MGLGERASCFGGSELGVLCHVSRQDELRFRIMV